MRKEPLIIFVSLNIAVAIIMVIFLLSGQGSWLCSALLAKCNPWRADFSQDTGEVLNIYCWNEEFRNCMTENYPGYKNHKDGTGTIGDVKVNWIIEESYDMNYQDKLDTALLMQDFTDDDKKIDIFLVEADYAPKYTKAKGVCVSMKELGLTHYMFNQYQYTKDVVTDNRGNVNGASPVVCPGLYVYRRSAARQVFGTDDPDEIQKHFSDWDKFASSAEELSDAGWKVVSGYDDAYRVYAQNVSTPWISKKGKIRIDDNLMKWVEQTKTFTERGCNNQTTLWSVDWMEGMTSSGDVFGYFGPAWFVDYSLSTGSLDDYWGEPKIGNGTWGDWAAIEGPAPYFWGGYWICVAQGSDNTGLAADIIYQLTCNENIMTDMISEDWSFCNNRQVMNRLAREGVQNEFLGGQNVLTQYCACAEKLRIRYTTAYDWDIEQCFQESMFDYFDGHVKLKKALENFYDEVKEIDYD